MSARRLISDRVAGFVSLLKISDKQAYTLRFEMEETVAQDPTSEMFKVEPVKSLPNELRVVISSHFYINCTYQIRPSVQDTSTS